MQHGLAAYPIAHGWGGFASRLHVLGAGVSGVHRLSCYVLSVCVYRQLPIIHHVGHLPAFCPVKLQALLIVLSLQKQSESCVCNVRESVDWRCGKL